MRAAKRRRGITLSDRGWERLQCAEQQAATLDNAGQPYTLAQLSDRSGLSLNTIGRLRQRQAGVDRQTLSLYFQAFGLELESTDYVQPPPPSLMTTPLRGQVPLASPFYIERPPAEAIAQAAIAEPGALIRIKAPRAMGKTSLMVRLLEQVAQRQWPTVILNLQLADEALLSDLPQFLQWFCATVAAQLGCTAASTFEWHDLFGSAYNCTRYFEQVILAHTARPVAIALDNVDVLFDYPETARGVFRMLRAWYEMGRYGTAISPTWRQLRLVIVHSTEVYLPLDVNHSPFNVGVPITLPEFSLAQVADLATRCQLEGVEQWATVILDWVGGQPFLVNLALRHIIEHDWTPAQFQAAVLAPDGLYAGHLQALWGDLLPHGDVLAALRQVVGAKRPVPLDGMQAFKLQSKGLIRWLPEGAVMSCQLYQVFFARQLGTPQVLQVLPSWNHA